MILSFKPQFVEPIQDGSKGHTIRKDGHNRWRKGVKIHFAIGVRTKGYRQFGEGICTGTQSIEIQAPRVSIEGRPLTLDEVNELAIRDGFKDIDGFFEWFKEPFKGKIIHWTEFKY